MERAIIFFLILMAGKMASAQYVYHHAAGFSFSALNFDRLQDFNEMSLPA
jgi:hypothetical protein